MPDIAVGKNVFGGIRLAFKISAQYAERKQIFENFVCLRGVLTPLPHKESSKVQYYKFY